MSVELEPRLIEPAIRSPRRGGTIVALAIVLGPLPLVVTFFVNLWRDRPQIRYDHALLLALKDQGEVARTSRIMQTLAPLKKTNDQSSYAPAQPRPTASQAGR